jgi:hypothetical protein
LPRKAFRHADFVRFLATCFCQARKSRQKRFFKQAAGFDAFVFSVAPESGSAFA